MGVTATAVKVARSSCDTEERHTKREKQDPFQVSDERTHELLMLQGTMGNQFVQHRVSNRNSANRPASSREALAHGDLRTLNATASEREAAAAEDQSAALIVEDDVYGIGYGQMTRSDYLTEVRAEVSRAVEAIVAPMGRSTADCPYLKFLFNFLNRRSAAYIDQTVRRFAPEASFSTARDYIPIITERVRKSTEAWLATGRISGLPKGVPTGLLGAVLSAGRGDSISASGLDTRLSDPIAIRAQIGSGSQLDSRLRSRMDHAFGYSFHKVRIHTDAGAASLAGSLNARAFTVGEHVAFAAGEYRPGTPLGDAIIAHELAHVIQQGNGTSTVGQTAGSSYASLEEDADRSAASVVASLWGVGREMLREATRGAAPALKSGLRLQLWSCNPTSPTTPTATATPSPTPEAAPPQPTGPTVAFNGNLSSSNLLSFPSGDQTLGRKDLRDRWIWQVEIGGIVSDAAAGWTMKQSYAGRRRRVLQNADGTTAPETDSQLSEPSDDPLITFQQTYGHQYFWIDGPGHLKQVSRRPVYSLNQVQNFTSWVERDSTRREARWHLRTVVQAGGVLDTARTEAGNGHVAT